MIKYDILIGAGKYNAYLHPVEKNTSNKISIVIFDISHIEN